ncbi:hypothetical protein [Pseudoalteromonas denitrificans]|uniref:Uncharacterized protein n=1 Tax=Pseudoalteromonas denitrificans DSM 6059 TaxID=1123010 RepID=A0A1I1R4C4_9GAMM|nr:hypothetical protein [Pseudoalteromonas denitrificans]SFD29244.1 hypothetical protein SAMN02745724_04107 [Pseudoalteromonas denitrificans DSM 6059]
MKNFFLFIILVLAFLSIDHPTVKEPRLALFNTISGMLSGSTQIEKNSTAKQTKKMIENKLELTSSQINYLTIQTKTNAKLKAFHKRFCEQNDLNLYFQGNDLRQVCQITAKQVKKITI